MRILLLNTQYDGLCQRAYAELAERGHAVSLLFGQSEEEILEAAARHKAQLIIVPFFHRAVPASVLEAYNVLTLSIASGSDRGSVIHKGSITPNWQSWSISVLQAGRELENGMVGASHTFKMHSECKSSFVRHHVAQAAVQDILKAVEKFERKTLQHRPAIGNFPQNRERLHRIRLF